MSITQFMKRCGKMSTKDDINQIYIDTSLLHEWFAGVMRGEKIESDPEIIRFLRENKELKKFISIFTIAELVEDLLFHEKKIRGHMKKLEVIESLSRLLIQITGIEIIELEKRDEHKGIFISPNVVKYTSICGSVKDATHVCIAEHEDLWLVTHDNKIGKLKYLYKKITTDTHLLKIFEK